MEIQGTKNSQNNLEKEEPSWRAQMSRFQILLHSYNNQDYVALAPGQIHR